jgi:hypothetical protein
VNSQRSTDDRFRQFKLHHILGLYLRVDVGRRAVVELEGHLVQPAFDGKHPVLFSCAGKDQRRQGDVENTFGRPQLPAPAGNVDGDVDLLILAPPEEAVDRQQSAGDRYPAEGGNQVVSSTATG